MYERWLIRIFWIPTLILLGVFINSLINNIEYYQDECKITSIIYPNSFESEIGWKNCTCGEEFCTGVCYCVKLFSNNNEDQVIQYSKNKYEDLECTFESILIPFKLNFQPIISKYFNKTVECWSSDEDQNIYLIEKESRNNLIFLIVIFSLVNLCCIGVEINYLIPKNRNTKSYAI